MKIEIEKVETHSRGVKLTNNYSVMNNAKIMEMLSSNLYSDKIKATIRELTVNALESCMMANNLNGGFVITLPTRDDPTFRIRDYGVGMSESFLINNYTKYGYSDKDHTNDYVGCMGIGSKSPFAIVSTFTTTSYYNGTKLIYVNNKCGNDGIPQLKKLYEGETNEPNGIEISFSVDPYTINDFRVKTAEILIEFPKCYKIIDQENLYQDIVENIVFQGNGWKIPESKQSYSYSRTSYAVMGYIRYPIDAQFIKHNLIDAGLILNFDIGEIDMDISREGLQYNKRTIENITKKLDQVQMELVGVITKDIEQCKNLYEARCKVSVGLRSISSIYNIARSVSYKGTILTKDLICPKDMKMTHLNCRYNKVYTSYNKNYLPISYNAVYLYNDLKSNYIKTIQDYALKNPTKTIIVIKDYDKDEALKYIGLDDFILVSSLAPQTKIKRSKVTRTKNIHVYKFIQNNGNNERAYFKSIDIDLKNESGYYIESVGTKILYNDKRHNPYSLYSLIEAYNNAYGVTAEIFALRPTHVKLIKKNPKIYKGWINIIDHCYEMLEKSLNQHKQYISDYLSIRTLSYNYSKTMSTLLRGITKIKSPKLLEILERYKEVNKEEYENYTRMNDKINMFKSPIIIPVGTFNKTIESIINEYGMIKYVSPLYTMDDAVIKYINLINY